MPWIGRGPRRPCRRTTLTRGDRATEVEVVALVGTAPLNASILTGPAGLDRVGVPAGPTGLLADAANAGEQGHADAPTPLRSTVGPQEDA
ncbi:hypothetical protein GCM10010240_63590 [Streptomyces griseoviridis]|nr:hypothetical protein GCM10010240_63590 [Streptomyces griseoviridis]